MKKLIICIILLLADTSFAFAHGSESHSSTPSASANSEDNSSSNSNSHMPENRFLEIDELIEAKSYREAHTQLKQLKRKNIDEAERLSLLGFTAQKYGDLKSADKFLNEALNINPKHANALRYQGELFIEQGKLEKAKENLFKIDRICWLPCSAELELKKALDNALAQ